MEMKRNGKKRIEEKEDESRGSCANESKHKHNKTKT